MYSEWTEDRDLSQVFHSGSLNYVVCLILFLPFADAHSCYLNVLSLECCSFFINITLLYLFTQLLMPCASQPFNSAKAFFKISPFIIIYIKGGKLLTGSYTSRKFSCSAHSILLTGSILIHTLL